MVAHFVIKRRRHISTILLKEDIQDALFKLFNTYYSFDDRTHILLAKKIVNYPNGVTESGLKEYGIMPETEEAVRQVYSDNRKTGLNKDPDILRKLIKDAIGYVETDRAVGGAPIATAGTWVALSAMLVTALVSAAIGGVSG